MGKYDEFQEFIQGLGWRHLRAFIRAVQELEESLDLEARACTKNMDADSIRRLKQIGGQYKLLSNMRSYAEKRLEESDDGR